MRPRRPHRLGRVTFTAATLALAAGATLSLGGCARTPVVDSPIVVDYAPDDVDAELNYWHGMTERMIVSNNEALHGLILFANESDPAADYPARVAWLQERGYLGKGFDAGADDAVDCGTIARALVPMLGIKGGVTMRLIGPNPRYALRELIYLGIMTYASPQQGISGIEFVGTISRAEAYQEASDDKRHPDKPTTDPTDDPDGSYDPASRERARDVRPDSAP